jgi:plasmid stability protein
MSYTVHMSTTITIRTDEPFRRKLEARAAAAGKSLSELVRDLLERALEERPHGGRTGHVKARLELARRPEEPWRRAIRDRNWRP